ncbi:GNAT family N-acetyltransferase [Bacillus sp. AFS001701]|uniref:GNAT family N-acetyltransferase n=1 Tax=Bacillaceae TaxID=186817 RepID=UPI000BF5BFD1|nr:GNAT family N-acetyltransferase [Bacillus sp. AFS001701]PET54561.1 GNAT family N-acetyltransferase [Bacillus sp. AFS001701]
MIRIAKKEDAKQIVPLIVQAIEDIVFMLTGTSSYEQATPILEYYVQSEQNRLSYHNCLVKEIEGKVVGVIIAYHSLELSVLDREMLEIISRNLNIQDVKVDKEADDEDFYIDTLSVNPDYQGKGIGTELLEGLLSFAKNKGIARVSLNVDQDKPSARRLYEKVGFKYEKVRFILNHSYDYLVFPINEKIFETKVV